ncbi:uncharacterized protein [Spinacia oleracea]|uniref:SWIM-type domain-containing protein n=1 Tax=Spinacia oleracea TaxID=3562 RepID=A0ABM3R5K7_SPIOL|nr:uncharacterized protein LOC130466226 [Spinacia oleracea]
MENSNYPFVGSFTRMLNDDQFFINQMNIDYGTHTSLLDTCTSPITNHLQQEPIGLDELQFVSLNRNNVDSDGVDREGEDANEELHMVGDDIIVEEEVDEEENVVALGATVQEFSRLSDVNDDEVNKWITWISMVSYKPGAEFCVGQEFSNKGALNEAVTSYSIKKNQRFIVLESRPHTVTFKCGRKPIGCSWKLRGSQKSYSSDVFTIVSYQGPHDSTCVSDILQLDHRNMDSKFISYHIRNLVEADISIKVRVLIEVIKQQYHFTISYKKAWLAKQKAIAYIFGDWEESFQILPHFMQEMKKANPGTVVHFANHRTADPNFEIFQRVFWAFGPSIQGFQHCRPIITIDGTHLYGKYKGTLLIAMSVDANNQIFPLAFAIVEGENGDSWPWFMACIRRFVTQRTGLCVLSDRHLGIMKAMTQDNSGWTEPYAYHRFCIRHLTSNVNTEFKNRELKNKVGWTAFQHQKKKFDYGLNMIAKMNEKAREYIGKINASKWSLCHDGGYRYGLKTTNLAEVFNNVLKGARFLPITALVKLTFYRVNSYFVERRRLSKKRLLDGHAYTIKVTKDLDTNTEKAMHHKVDIFHHEHGIYQVTTGRGDRADRKGGHSHTVNFSLKTCTCNKLQIYKIPCSHVLACCRAYSLSPSQFIDPYFTSGEYVGTYNARFFPIPDKDYWSPYNGPKVVADTDQKRTKGRPPSKRLRNEMDESVRGKVTCSICRQKGHNKKTCSLRSHDLHGGSSTSTSRTT